MNTRILSIAGLIIVIAILAIITSERNGAGRNRNDGQQKNETNEVSNQTSNGDAESSKNETQKEPEVKIEVLKEGSGSALAADGDSLTVNYTGTLADGKKFDSSLDEGRSPFVFVLGVGEVIQGWDQGLLNMKVGEKRRLTIPPELAYGETGAPPAIPQNATLFFDVELISIKKSGLAISVLKEGFGDRKAAKGDSVVVNYTGMLVDGKKFDSSLDRNEPFTFTLGSRQVISGWDLGILGMKVGEKRKLSIPPELAYGVNGRPPIIPSNATLIFDVEMVSIN